jgi:DNA-binding transcriptional regulator/RsmH inhibitor MraZ
VLLTGKDLYTVDAKRRVNLPSKAVDKFLADIAALGRQSKVTDLNFILTYGPNACIFIDLEEIFEKRAVKIHQSYGSRATTDDEARRFLFETFMNPSVRCDQQGRITVPQEYLDYAKIKIGDKACIISIYDRLELWNPDLLNEFMNASKLTPLDRLKQFAGVEKD